jgi:hypothetical protein
MRKITQEQKDTLYSLIAQGKKNREIVAEAKVCEATVVRYRKLFKQRTDPNPESDVKNISRIVLTPTEKAIANLSHMLEELLDDVNRLTIRNQRLVLQFTNFIQEISK